MGKRPRSILEMYRQIEGPNCVYCGELRQCGDHVVAIHWAEDPISQYLTPDAWIIVPCCNECNYIAGSKFFPSFASKRLFIRAELESWYANDAKVMAEWSDEDLAMMGRSLWTTIAGSIARAKRARQRLAYEIPDEMLDDIRYHARYES